MLQDTLVRVAALHERRLASTPVTQAIADCFVEIDRYLADFLVAFYPLKMVCPHSLLFWLVLVPTAKSR
jgi:hypothetical protein